MGRFRMPPFPGTERSNIYCPLGCRHPWRWRPTDRANAHWYDPGWRAVRFIEGLCRHTKGRYRGMPFILLPFQLADTLQIFGTVDEAGLRTIRKVYLEWARKNGKSEIGAAYGLKLLCADGEAAPEVYGAAHDEDQASLIYNVAADMVELEPRLQTKLRVIRSRKRIVHRTNGGFYRTIPSDEAGAQGFNASGVIFDEIHTQRDRELWDALDDSTQVRAQPLTVGLTTAGFDRNSLCRELHDYGERLKKGTAEEDPTWFFDIRNVPEKADWLNERYWFIANPALGTKEDIAAGKAFKSLEAVRQKAQEAREIPSYQNRFRRNHLNQWTAQEARAIDLSLWDQEPNIQVFEEQELHGEVARSGLDLASTTDLAALVHVFPAEDDPEAIWVVPRFWLPADGLLDRARRDRVPYDVWVREGFIEATPGNVIDYGAIRTRADRDARDFDIADIGFDRWGATQLSQELDDAGLEVVPIPQTFGGLGPATVELLRRIKAGKVRHGGNPVLRWMVDCVVLDQDPNGNLKPNKKKSAGRIDGFVALVMALDRQLRADGFEQSAYEEHGVESV